MTGNLDKKKTKQENYDEKARLNYPKLNSIYRYFRRNFSSTKKNFLSISKKSEKIKKNRFPKKKTFSFIQLTCVCVCWKTNQKTLLSLTFYIFNPWIKEKKITEKFKIKIQTINVLWWTGNKKKNERKWKTCKRIWINNPYRNAMRKWYSLGARCFISLVISLSLCV